MKRVIQVNQPSTVPHLFICHCYSQWDIESFRRNFLDTSSFRWESTTLVLLWPAPWHGETSIVPCFGISLTLPPPSSPILVHWHTPPMRFCKINTDGCFKMVLPAVEWLYENSLVTTYMHSPLHLGNALFLRLSYVLFLRGFYFLDNMS